MTFNQKKKERERERALYLIQRFNITYSFLSTYPQIKIQILYISNLCIIRKEKKSELSNTKAMFTYIAFFSSLPPKSKNHPKPPHIYLHFITSKPSSKIHIFLTLTPLHTTYNSMKSRFQMEKLTQKKPT